MSYSCFNIIGICIVIVSIGKSHCQKAFRMQLPRVIYVVIMFKGELKLNNENRYINKKPFSWYFKGIWHDLCRLLPLERGQLFLSHPAHGFLDDDDNSYFYDYFGICFLPVLWQKQSFKHWGSLQAKKLAQQDYQIHSSFRRYFHHRNGYLQYFGRKTGRIFKFFGPCKTIHPRRFGPGKLLLSFYDSICFCHSDYLLFNQKVGL